MSTDVPSAVDALVIGGGPAGLSAATWLGRYQRSTLVVDAGQHRNRFADRAHGLLGRDPIAPGQLLAESRAGLEQYLEVTIHDGTVASLRRGEDGMFTADVDGERVTAQRVVLATGVSDRFPELSGFDAHYGTDVHHCPACDGHTARGQVVIVLGAGPQLPAYASEMLDWAPQVRIITGTGGPRLDGDELTMLSDHGIEVVDGVPEALIGDPGSLVGVELTDGRLVEGDKVFFSYAHHPVHELAQDLGCALDDEGRLVVNGYQLTSVDGVYAAGDIVTGLQLVPIAIGTGSAAGVACATSLRGHRTTDHSPAPAPPANRFRTG